MTTISERMPRSMWPFRRRLIIQGTLVLQTPTHLGNGDSEGPTDMGLLRDSRNDAALLTGASIAGALRNYLRAATYGLFTEEPRALHGVAEQLFGGRKGDDDGSQSLFIVNDALSRDPAGKEVAPQIELRDGVKIDSDTGTPANKTKYDLELLAAGTRFDLCFELRIPAAYSTEQENELRQIMAQAIDGLSRGAIGIGMKKRRGFGRCQVAAWKVWDFDLNKPTDLLAWLAFERSYGDSYDRDSQPLAKVAAPLSLDVAHLEATFKLEGSVLIRAGQDEGADGPDVRHLHAIQATGESLPVISGTSLAGVLRHRAERIANTLQPGSGEYLVSRVFGDMPKGREDKALASRLVVYESVIQHAITDLIQNRVAIDRFTGGAYDGALFEEQPVFSKPETRVTLRIDLYQPQDGELGLLLLLLKDLWTGDLAVGGERSIGRGRLCGLEAKLTRSTTTLARFEGDGPVVRLVEGDSKQLEGWVKNLPALLQKEATHDISA